MVKINVQLSLSVDEEEYHLPCDGDVAADIEEQISTFIYDVGGVEISNIKVRESKL